MLGLGLGAVLAPLHAQTVVSPAAKEQGRALPGLETFDRAMHELLAQWKVPGASLALAYRDRLVLAKGYGVADAETGRPMTPEVAFRMASVTKTLTAVLALRLEAEGRLNLDDTLLPWLRKRGAAPPQLADARASAITLRQLLQHTAGFDSERSGDPLFQPLLREVARRQNQAPVTCAAIARDQLERALDFAPGERFAYSNVGYCMLGLALEAAGGDSIEKLIGERVLQPVIGKPYRLGSSLQSAPDESRYHPFEGETWQRGAPGVTDRAVPRAYGAFSIEAMAALGGWVATPTDALGFFLAIDGTRGAALLDARQLQRMREAPALTTRPPTDMRRHYGLGVLVVGTPQGDNWFHHGSLWGLSTQAVRTARGWSWVVAFNTRPEAGRRPAFELAYDRALWRAALAVPTWPEGDLF